MGSSLLTNRAAMTALQTLRTISENMQSTQNRISTGRRITEAADNTAYWAISNSMKSDSQTTSVIKDALHLGKARVDQAYTANQQIKKELQDIKSLVVSAHGMTADDQKKIEVTINTKLENIKTAITSGALNGSNLLAQNGKDKIDIAASFRRNGDQITVDKIALDPKALQLAGMSDNGKVNFAEGLLKDLFDEKNPIFKVNFNYPHEARDGKDNVDGKLAKPISSENLDKLAARVQKALDVIANVDSVLGAAKKQVDSQYEFINRLIDNLDKSVGTLVDADMNAESARLSALQVQQQLAVQALSIANQSSQNLLTLFRR